MADRKKKALPFVDPQPVAKSVACSACDLSWDAHGEDPDVTDCIRLLKAEAKKKPLSHWSIQGNQFATSSGLAVNHG